MNPVTLPAVAEPSILGGGMTGAGMITASAPLVSSILSTTTPGFLRGLGLLGSGELH